MKNQQALDQKLESLRGRMTDTLAGWIRQPSLKDESKPGAPYGDALKDMLALALRDCEALGFKTQNFDGYAGDAQMGEGSDEDALAILAHVDIVPVGDGWTRDPFGAQIEGNVMYGRGTSDDKGPLAAALYAMYAVKEAGIPLKRKVKLIIGCDEESGMEDIAYYKTVTTIPKTGFSPDATYPVINLEKGMVSFHLTAPLSREGLQVVSLSVGERLNVVPGSASAVVEGGEGLIPKVDQISKRYGWPVKAEMKNGRLLLTATGINGHAAYPGQARNAIGQLLITLRELGAKGALAELADKVGTQYDGENLGIKACDQASGDLTCNMGILRVKDGEIFATLDIRYPLLISGERLKDVIQAHLTGIKAEQVFSKLPHYVPESSALVQGLLDAYHQVTGREKKALSTGGGTYARMLKEGVAFGASFPEDPDVAHQADEHINLENLMKSMKIFAYAIVNLAGEQG